MLVTQLCLTLCDPLDCSPPGSSVHEIFQARILSGLPFPSPGDLPNPGVEPRSPILQADSLLTELQGKPRHIAFVSLIRHILIKLTKTKHKERLLKAAREKQQVTYKGNPIRLTADLSAEALQARREWQDI